MTDYVIPNEQSITEADLIRWEAEGRWVDVVDGQAIEVDTAMMTFAHTDIIANLYDILKPFAKTHDLGYVHGDGLQYILAVDEHGVRSVRTPDLAFLRKERIPQGRDRHRPFHGAPDLAVEVLSPGQGIVEILDRLSDYFKAGTEESWVIYPLKQELHRYHRDDPAVEIFRLDDTLASALFPGLSLAVRDIFTIEGE